jgi:hypothetical protein
MMLHPVCTSRRLRYPGYLGTEQILRYPRVGSCRRQQPSGELPVGHHLSAKLTSFTSNQTQATNTLAFNHHVHSVWTLFRDSIHPSLFSPRRYRFMSGIIPGVNVQSARFYPFLPAPFPHHHTTWPFFSLAFMRKKIRKVSKPCKQ